MKRAKSFRRKFDVLKAKHAHAVALLRRAYVPVRAWPQHSSAYGGDGLDAEIHKAINMKGN